MTTTTKTYSPMLRAFEAEDEEYSPLFEVGESEEQSISRIRVERKEPEPGYVGDEHFSITEKDILVNYGPGKYQLTAFKGSKYKKQITVVIGGDRDEWEEVRQKFLPRHLRANRRGNDGADASIVIGAIQTMSKDLQTAMVSQQQTILEVTKSSAKEQADSIRSMAEIARIQSAESLERAKLDVVAERERNAADRERLKQEHEQQMERDRERRRDEIATERERIAADRERDKEFMMVMLKMSEGKNMEMIQTMTAMKELISGKDDNSTLGTIMKMAPEVVEALKALSGNEQAKQLLANPEAIKMLASQIPQPQQNPTVTVEAPNPAPTPAMPFPTKPAAD